MATLGKLWAGRVYGTNTGNLFLELQVTGTSVVGTLRFLDTSFGLALYTVHGTFDDALRIKGTPVKTQEGIELGELVVDARLTPEGNLRGTWRTSIETAGTFDAYPHDSALTDQKAQVKPGAPEQLYTKNIHLGAVRLYGDDAKKLIALIRQDFTTGRPIVTFNARGGEISRYVEDFLSEAGSLGPLEYLKIMIQEPEAYGINRLVVVELNAYGSNEVRAQGVQESWVIGKAEALAAELRKHESMLVTTYKKHGLNLNQAVFFVMLIIMPSVAKWIDRAMFAVAVFFLLSIMLWLHARFIPNAMIQLSTVQPSFLARAWPTILSWLVAATASLAAALLLYWLTGRAS